MRYGAEAGFLKHNRSGLQPIWVYGLRQSYVDFDASRRSEPQPACGRAVLVNQVCHSRIIAVSGTQPVLVSSSRDPCC